MPTLDDALLRLRDVAAPPGRIIDALAAGLAIELGVAGAPASARLPAVDAALAAVPVADRTPWLMGRAREVLHPAERRRALGAWFTPPDLARRLVAEASTTADPRRILDPACGGGAFLLAAHERWPDAHLCGIDADPLAAATTAHALDLAGATDVDVSPGDGLAPREVEEYDLILTNPPFLSQLRQQTARSPERRRQLRDWLGSAATGYVDDAALFVLAALRDLEEGGSAVLIVPESLLAAADAGAVRDAVARRGDVEVVWRDTGRIFQGTPTCAIRVCGRGRDTPRPSDAIGHSWSSLLVQDVPPVHVTSDRLIGAVATATADFREAYYLLADHVAEARPCGCGAADPHARAGCPDLDVEDPIATVGMIDPAHLRWGTTTTRFAKRRWTHPVARDVPPDFRARRLGVKVMVATQTRVIEAVVDADGRHLPSTPVISVRTDQPWHVGAALTSPVLTAVAARRHAGAARSRGALKLSAAQVLALPLPDGPSTAWDDAAEAYRRAHATADPAVRRDLLIVCGRAMTQAYGSVDGGLVTWWVDRLPDR